jgi:hypothetical protein
MTEQLSKVQEVKDSKPTEPTSSKSIDLPKTAVDEPSKVASTLRQQTAMYNQACISEANRLIKDVGSKILTRFKQIADLYKERWTNQLPLWTKSFAKTV